MSAALELSPEQRDALQEISNVAMGRASDSLARWLETYVTLSIPTIQVLDAGDLSTAIDKLLPAGLNLCSLQHQFTGQQDAAHFSCNMVTVTSQEALDHIRGLLSTNDELVSSSPLLDLSNLIAANFPRELAQQLGFSGLVSDSEPLQSTPTGIDLSSIVSNQASHALVNSVLVLEFNYCLGQHVVTILSLVQSDSIRFMQQQLNQLLN